MIFTITTRREWFTKCNRRAGTVGQVRNSSRFMESGEAIPLLLIDKLCNELDW